MKKKKRYTSPPWRWYDFADTFFVECPACRNAAIVKIPGAFHTKKAAAHCIKCNWQTDYEARQIYQPADNAICAECNTKLPPSTIKLPKINKFAIINCEKCTAQNRVVRWTKSTLKYNQTGIIEPVFGLNLYFQAQIGSNTLWVINEKHLHVILQFTEAKLRQKADVSYRMTFVEKLPKFIIAAKNREKVLETLLRWEKAMEAFGLK